MSKLAQPVDELREVVASEAINYSQAALIVAHDLEGTRQSMEAALERHDFEGYDNNWEFCAAIDARVFCCTQCDWWFDVSQTGNDVNGQWACIECGGEIGE